MAGKLKTCSMCGRELPLDQFYSAAGYADGFTRRCKECIAKASLNSYYNRREIILERRKKRSEAEWQRLKEKLEAERHEERIQAVRAILNDFTEEINERLNDPNLKQWVRTSLQHQLEINDELLKEIN